MLYPWVNDGGWYIEQKNYLPGPLVLDQIYHISTWVKVQNFQNPEL